MFCLGFQSAISILAALLLCECAIVVGDIDVGSGTERLAGILGTPLYKADFTVIQCANDGGPGATKVICVLVKIPEGSVGIKAVACKALAHEPHRVFTPFFAELLIDSEVVDCTGETSCEYFIQRGVKSDSSYDVFCVGFNHTFVDGGVVEPQCPSQRPSGPGTCGLQVSTGAGSKFHDVFGLVDLMAALLLMSYIGWSFLFERVRILHETGFAVIVGVVCGIALKYLSGQTAQFNYHMFSYFLLPMVIFAAGFNMRKKNFFRYFGYIATLGILGTVTIFVMIYCVSKLFSFTDAAGGQINLEAHQLLIMASVLSSTDSVAPMAFLPAASFPRLYAVIFGEGVLNDVVSILLSKSVEGSTKLPSALNMVGNISYFFATSLAMGIGFALPTALLFRQAKVLHEETVKPCALLMLLNYSCYVVAEVCDISSIFALFVCAILSSHYARYSLSAEAQKFTTEVSEFFCYMAEAFVFGYFGLTAVTYLSDPSSFSVGLILCYSACVICARFLSVLLLALGLRLLRCGDALALKFEEWCLVAFAGCMRGTIAYALILRAVPPQKYQNKTQTILVSTVLGIVLLNSLVFGALFPLVLRLLGIKPRGEGRQLSCNSDVSELSHVAGGQVSTSAALSQARPYPTQLRAGVDRWWHYIDARWLRPLFRPDVDDFQPTNGDTPSSQRDAEVSAS